MRHIIFILLTLSFFACQNNESTDNQTSKISEPETSTEAKANTQVEVPELLQETFDALGGLETWRSFRTLEFDQKGGLLGDDHQVIDLQDRRLMVKADSFMIGHDGAQVWVSPSKEAVPKVPARFYSSLYFYFFAVPYVLADSGVNLEKMPDQEMGGNTYEVLKATFQDGTGDSSDDEFRIYINPETKEPAYMLYTVSYFDKKPNENFNAIHFEEMQEVNGLKLPKVLTWHAYEEGVLGEKQSSVTFENVTLKAEPMAEEMYAMPEEAEVDAI